MNTTFHKPIKSMPVAKFYYKGSHSHPIRRTILIIETTKDIIRGYELREGHTVRKLKDAPIKSFRRKKIPNYSNIGKAQHKKPGPKITTLKRYPILELLKVGA